MVPHPERPVLLRLMIPDPALVLLVGPSGAGKSTFANRNFRPTEVVSSDRCRAMIIDDEANQNVSAEAFSLLRHIARSRLGYGRLTVIDATNLEYRARRPLLRMARAVGLPTVAIIFDLSLASLIANNQTRSSRLVPAQAITSQVQEFESTRRRLDREGYVLIYRLDEVTSMAAEIERSLPPQAELPAG